MTGLLYISPDSSDVHEQNNTVATPLAQVPYEQLCPGSAELEKLQAGFQISISRQLCSSSADSR